MISELKDDEILEFLMNSDFDGDYSPDELKYLLVKWRYFYRSLYGKLGRVKDDTNGEISLLQDEIKGLKQYITQLQHESVRSEEQIKSLKDRNLTWKERFTGKIITKKDEHTGVQEA